MLIGVQKKAGTFYPNASEDVRALSGKRYSFATDAEAIIKKKRPDVKDVPAVVSELQKFETSAERKAALHWFVRGAIRLPEDAPKVTQALGYAKRAKADALKYDSPMACMEDLHDFKPKAEPINPDTVPELTNKREFDYGVTVYDVQDDRAGQRAMRRIINTHFGEDANPWCLLQGDGRGNLTEGAWHYWNHYNAIPKRVAFRDGKLVCFIANEVNALACWNRKDEDCDGVQVGMVPAPANPYGVKTVEGVLDPDTGDVNPDDSVDIDVRVPLPENPYGVKNGKAWWHPADDSLSYYTVDVTAPLPPNPYGLKEGRASWNPDNNALTLHAVPVTLPIPENPLGETGEVHGVWYPDFNREAYSDAEREGEFPAPPNPYGIERMQGTYNLITKETSFSPVKIGEVLFDTPFDGRREKALATFYPSTGETYLEDENGRSPEIVGEIKLPEGNPLGRELVYARYYPNRKTLEPLGISFSVSRENRAWAENYINELFAKFTPRITVIKRFSLSAEERIETALNGVTAESLTSALDDVILNNLVAIRGTDSDKLAIKVVSEAFFAKYSRMKIGLSTGAYLFFAPDERAVDRNGGDRSLAWAEYALHQVTNARTDKEGNRYRVFNREKVEVVNPQLEKIVREDKTEISEDGSVLFFSQLTNDTYAKVVARPVEDGNYRADLSDVTSVYGKGKIPGKLNPLAEVHDKGGLGGVFSPVSARGTIANSQTPAQDGDARYALGVNPRLYEDVEEALNTDPENGKVLKGGTAVYLGETPELFSKLDLPTGKVFAKANTLRKLAKEHDLTAEQMASVSDVMSSPVAIFADEGRGYVLLTDVSVPNTEGNNAPLMVYLKPAERGDLEVSAFSGKPSDVSRFVRLANAGEMLYVDGKKMEALPISGEVKQAITSGRVKPARSRGAKSAEDALNSTDKRYALYWLDPSLEEDPTPIFAQVAAERLATAKLSGKVDPLDGQIYKEIYGVNPEAVSKYVDEYLEKNGRAFQSTEELIQAIGAEAYARQRDNKSLDAYIAGFAEGAGQASYATQLRMAQTEAMKQYMENISGADAWNMQCELGFSLARTVLGMVDAERKMSKEEIAERVKKRRERARKRYLAKHKAEAGDKDAEKLFEQDAATSKDWKKYREIFGDPEAMEREVERLKQEAQEGMNADKAEREARRKKREENKKKDEKKKEKKTDEEEGKGKTINLEEKLTIPRDFLYAKGIDLADPETLMWFIQQYVMNKWMERENMARTPEEIGGDPRFVRDVQCTLHNALHDLAIDLCYSERRDSVLTRFSRQGLACVRLGRLRSPPSMPCTQRW